MIDELSNRAVIAMVLVVVVVMPAVGITISDTTPTSGTIPIQTESGTTIYVTNTDGRMALSDPWEGPNEVRIQTGPAAGNGTIIADGNGNITLDQLEGSQTQLSGIDAGSTEIYVNPDDKDAVNISEGIDSLDYGSITVDDGTADFTYTASTNQGELTVRGVPANADIRAVEAGTSNNLGGGNSNASGTVRLTQLQQVSTTDVELRTSTGGPGLSNPGPQGTQTDFPTTLSIDVSDPDFSDGENVSVEFFLDGNSVGNNTTESSGTVTQTISKPSRGNHTAKAVATDSTGNTNTLNWKFAVPESLFVNRLTDPGTRIDDRQVNVTFREDGEVFRRTTTNGEISLEGLPVEGDIVASASAESTSGLNVKNRAYFDNEIIVEDISVPETIYLLDTNASTTTTRFTLEDRTGDFEGNGAQLLVQFVDNSSGNPTYETYIGDEFGVEGVTATLVEGDRYRLIVMNEDNDQRVLGTYDADVNETVPLTVGSVAADPEDPGLNYQYNASYLNNTQDDFVKFGYNDSAELTSSVTVEIYERGDRSNKLVDNQTFSGPLGTFSISEKVPQGQKNVSWVVSATVLRDGETQNIRKVVGDRQPILGGMAPWLQAVISIGSLFVVAGLFSRLNASVGGLVVAGLGGIYFFVGLLPQETGIGVVLLAMIVAAVLFIRGRARQ